MLYLWNKGKRNGALRRLGYLRRGLFSAALEYCRMKGKIAHPRLVTLIESIAELIKNSIGAKILSRGKDRALEMIKNPHLNQIFPTFSEWVKINSYVFWLGTTLLEGKKTWINYY